jgi:methionyl-tRNA formyltransferase
MKIIFFGTPQQVVPVLDNLTKQFEVVAVVTTPDQKSGRKQIVTPSPVKIYAENYKIPVLTPSVLNDETVKQLMHIKADLYIVAAYGKIIPHALLTVPKYGAINIHPSLLPKYRGPTPIQTTLLNGDSKSGITFMMMDEKMDHGPIIHQIPLTLEKTDTFEWLMNSIFKQAAQILQHVIDSYVSDKSTPLKQDESQATYTKMITKEDGRIDLDNPPEPEQLDRMVRAYYPWPTVWTTVTFEEGFRTKGNTEVQEKIIKFLPGNKLQMEGKNPVSTKDFLNGYPQMKDTLKKLGFE